MAEEEEQSKVVRSGRIAGQRLDPEKGPTGAAVRLQEMAEKALEENLLEVVECILDNIRVKHLPSAKLLMELARRLDSRKVVLEVEYQSLAEVLWLEVQELGTGNWGLGTGDQGPGTRD